MELISERTGWKIHLNPAPLPRHLRRLDFVSPVEAYKVWVGRELAGWIVKDGEGPHVFPSPGIYNAPLALGDATVALGWTEMIEA